MLKCLQFQKDNLKIFLIKYSNKNTIVLTCLVVVLVNPFQNKTINFSTITKFVKEITTA
jgi:hypothetical protein